jgi:hypothetical protein
MKIIQMKFAAGSGWTELRHDHVEHHEIDLVLGFAPSGMLKEGNLYDEVSTLFPMAQIILSSSAGEFIDDKLSDDALTLTAIRFEKAKVKTAMTDITTSKNSFEAGYYLSRAFEHKGLRSLILFCDGQQVNASQLAFSLQQYLPPDVIITGGLAGSQDKQPSLIGLNSQPAAGRIACIGFYGEELKVTYGNNSGWIPFGPERKVTRSKNNTVYELGGIPVLEVYNLYLRDRKYNIAGSQMLFPIAVRFENSAGTVIRTIQSVDEGLFSITYSGNVPEGSKVSLLRADSDSLINGAANAVSLSTQQMPSPELAIIMSCAERRNILNGRSSEELLAIKNALGRNTAISGLFTPGEIAPAGPDLKCELFKQSVIVTAISEN